MNVEDLAKSISIRLPLGHVLLAWETLSDKFSELRSNGSLSEEERRAIWGLADLLEKTLVEHGLGARSQAEWDVLIQSSKEFIKTIPVDFLD